MLSLISFFLSRRRAWIYRNIFDGWFIMNSAYPLDKAMIKAMFGNRAEFFQAMLRAVKKADSKKILQDAGRLLEEDP
jgi:hypothetical protein